MTQAVFLSASVPDSDASAEFAASSNSVAISSAVSALVHVVLGRRLLVWGGHPAITPMVQVVAEHIGVQYGEWVRLYQSRYFEEMFPEENEKFANVTFVDAAEDRGQSLAALRTRMFSDFEYEAGVFIGGMDGIVREFELFRRLQPSARVVPIVSTGGAASDLAKVLQTIDEDLTSDLDYVSLLHRHLDIPYRERRYPRPADQPVDPVQRYWTT